ncbi:hypothetical protein [Microbacterium sp. SLBN-146]|uniref:hypothetical protein n=1 Tax=Microbacterium sp. SLBN-146 TaxID=2768457 RepID=UPI00114E3CEE|nr:hypothetical protein [Microbacterium sp. SLBN-146]TQJ31856.1 hypothetical protein FBY39_2341 [Microbacterium sp. SLBN-146]
MTFPSRRVGAVIALTAALVLLTACAQDPGTEPEPTDTAVSAPSSPAPEPSETDPTSPEAGEPACETIIPVATVTDFESVGWTYEESPFYIGELEIVDGIMCVWADFDAPAGDHLQLYGWAPITPDDARAAQSSLTSQGWIREEAAEGVYITENPETTIAVDAEGYGMTYLFTDGAVELADTKQGLLLVEWPKA